MRAILLERGIVVPQGRWRLSKYLDAPDDALRAVLSRRLCLLIEDMRRQWCELDRRIAEMDDEFSERARHDRTARRLASIPGIGVLNATALVAAIGDGRTFRRARDLAAWLGLVPRQVTTGGKPRLVGITKRGNKYLRTLLVHRARSVLRSLAKSATPLGNWLRSLLERVHRNVAVVVLANKLARIVWAVMRQGKAFEGAVAGASV